MLYNAIRTLPKVPFPWGIYTPCNTCSVEPPDTRHSIPKSISIGSAIFVQSMADSLYTLQ